MDLYELSSSSFSDFLQEIFRRNWFLQKINAFIQDTIPDDGIVRIARHNNELTSRFIWDISLISSLPLMTGITTSDTIKWIFSGVPCTDSRRHAHSLH